MPRAHDGGTGPFPVGISVYRASHIFAGGLRAASALYGVPVKPVPPTGSFSRTA